MQRIALAFAVWSLLLLTIAGLAMLALPEVGPPMPRRPTVRSPMEALVPEREVSSPSNARPLAPDQLSGTVAPEVVPSAPKSPDAAPTVDEPSDAPSPGVDETAAPHGERTLRPASTEFGGREAAGREAAGQGLAGQGLGVLPPGVPAEEEGLGLHVVRSDGRPAIGASVRWMLQRDLDALQAQGRDVDSPDPAELLAGSTRTASTNSSGFAMLTSEAGTMWLDARMGDQYGWARIRREDGGYVKLVLSRDTTLSVEVLDSTGRARAGVPVVLRGVDCRAIWSGKTGVDGRARLAHADGVIQAAHARFQDLTLTVDVPNGDARVLDRGEIPTEAVRLVAEPGQRVLVWLRDAHNQPCSKPTRVTLAPVGLEADCSARRERIALDGLAVFEEVPPQSHLVVTAEGTCSPVPLRAEVQVAQAAEANVILAATADMPRVVGRFVDARGGPWRSFQVTAFVQMGGTWVAQGSSSTGDRGEFELDLAPLHDARGPVTISLVARNDYGRTVVAQPIELAVQPDATRRALGDVVAADWPILVRGTVLDEDQRPIEAAVVELCDASGRPDPRTRTTSDDRAQFVLRGPAPEGEAVLVHAVEPETRAADATVAMRRGDWREKIVIAVHGRVRGTVVLPEGAPSGAVIVHLVPPSGTHLALSVDAVGAFEFANVEPGEARVSFTVEGFDTEIFVLDRVGVPRGGVCTDPRLAHVDLRDRVAIVELEVVDERGEPIETGWVGPVTTTRTRGRSYEMLDGIARVVIVRNGPTVQVSADGYESVLLQSPTGRVRVQMKPSGQ